jgi:hypothetical protein
MPKRVLDFDAMWGSDKLAACAAWAQAEYAWLYGLADASGCFELTNLRVIWGRVAAIRRDLTIERLEQVFDEFHDKGLLFLWVENGKRYGHWTGSDVPGRLPPPSWRIRLERFAPPVPKAQFAEYMSRFARGRAASGGAFLATTAPAAPNLALHSDLTPALNADLKPALASPCSSERQGAGSLEAAQAQDWNLNWDREGERKVGRAAPAGAGQGSSVHIEQTPVSIFSEQSKPENQRPELVAPASEGAPQAAGASRSASPPGPAPPMKYLSAKELQVARELVVGLGPVCQPGQVKPEALERIRAREAARRRS